MNNPHLIGLHGEKESGKDTTADLIQKWSRSRGYTAVRQAFADKLKASAAAGLGWSPSSWTGRDPIEFCNLLKDDQSAIRVTVATQSGPVSYEITGRKYLQLYGTEGHRNVFGQHFWVDAVLPVTEGALGMIYEHTEESASVTPIPDWWENFLTTDSSDLFENEIPDLVADYCLITDVRFPNEAQRIIDLGGEIWKIERDNNSTDTHASEQALDPALIDVVIDNNGPLSQLQESVDTIMTDLTSSPDGRV